MNETNKSEDTTRVHAHLHRSQHKNEQKHTISVDGCVGGCLFQLLVCLLGLPRALLPSFLCVWCVVPLIVHVFVCVVVRGVSLAVSCFLV